jgi:hypothetical protein
MPKSPPSTDQGDASKAETDAFGNMPHPLARQLYNHALTTRTPVSWNLFHQTGDILFIADDTIDSRAIRVGQAALRFRECASLRRSPRFSHVFLCVTPGLYIESTPVALLHSHDKPAVRAVRTENYDRVDRSDFLVMRPYALFKSPELNAKIIQRCVFHHDRPYNFRPVSASGDRMRCSELVATIYGDLGIQLVADRPYHETLPFDIEVALEKPDAWLDVTELYMLAERLSHEKLIKERYPDLRNTFFRQYASGAEITKLLNEWGDAADAVVKDIQDQMARPVQFSPSERELTYIANLKDLLAILKKYFALYTDVRRYASPGPALDGFRFDGIKPDILVGKLNTVEEAHAKLAWTGINIVINAYTSECRQFVETAKQGAAVLAEDATDAALTAALEHLRKLIRAADDREPEAERGDGEALMQEIAALIQEIETVEISPDADPKLMKGFSLAAGKLYILARRAQGWFYGSKFLKLLRTSVAHENGFLYDAEFRAALAPSRQLMRDLLRDQCQLFEPRLANNR